LLCYDRRCTQQREELDRKLLEAEKECAVLEEKLGAMQQSTQSFDNLLSVEQKEV